LRIFTVAAVAAVTSLTGGVVMVAILKWAGWIGR
jgi:hypothetical protein